MGLDDDGGNRNCHRPWACVARGKRAVLWTCRCVIDDHEMTAPRVLAQSTLRIKEASKRRGMCSATSSDITHVDASL